MQKPIFYSIFFAAVVLVIASSSGIGNTALATPSSQSLMNSSSSNSNTNINTTDTESQFSSSSTAAPSSSNDTEEVRVIQHGMGETAITGTPQRIVILWGSYSDDLLTLGVQPIGATEPGDMRTNVLTDIHFRYQKV
jgi:ABC-type Fe3+-citrate transport system substrate-binding protein